MVQQIAGGKGGLSVSSEAVACQQRTLAAVHASTEGLQLLAGQTQLQPHLRLDSGRQVVVESHLSRTSCGQSHEDAWLEQKNYTNRAMKRYVYKFQPVKLTTWWRVQN